jgi:hypothetical protein
MCPANRSSPFPPQYVLNDNPSRKGQNAKREESHVSNRRRDSLNGQMLRRTNPFRFDAQRFHSAPRRSSVTQDQFPLLEARQMFLSWQLDEVKRLREADSTRFFAELRLQDDRRRLEAERVEQLSGDWRNGISQLSSIVTAIQSLQEVMTVGFSRLNELLERSSESKSVGMSGICRELSDLRSTFAKIPSVSDVKEAVDQLKVSESRRFTRHFIPFRGSPLDGIISHLTRESGDGYLGEQSL